jgi:hypothetical protein
VRLRLTVFSLVLGALVAASPAAADVELDRARAAYAAMQTAYFDPHTGSYREQPGLPPSATAWPVSQALAATLALRRLPAVQRALALLARRYHVGGVYAAQPGGPVFWDDNEWIALDLLDWNALRPDRDAVRQAAVVFGAVARAWDADATRPCAGGVRWTASSANLDRGTVSTATGALLGLRLYALTGRPVFLWWSRRMLAWIDDCMLAPNGLFWDHLDGGGRLDPTQWSYNQGSALGAYLLLYEATGDPAMLARAESIADAALAAFAGRWHDEPPEFAAIFFRRLLELARTAGRDDYVAAARAYGDSEWAAARDSLSGLFVSGGRPTLLAQAAFVQLYAVLAATGDR